MRRTGLDTLTVVSIATAAAAVHEVTLSSRLRNSDIPRSPSDVGASATLSPNSQWSAAAHLIFDAVSTGWTEARPISLAYEATMRRRSRRIPALSRMSDDTWVRTFFDAWMTQTMIEKAVGDASFASPFDEKRSGLQP